jgi:hypothetical protein
VFNSKIALISVTLLVSVTITQADGFTHCVLASFLIIPLIYLLYNYIKSHQSWWLIGTVLVAGLIIQFQMAFGVPITILLGGYAIFDIIKNKNFLHLLAGLLLLLPLSTFLVFDVRHDFIQFRSMIDNFKGVDGGSFSLNGYWPDRWTSFIDAFSFWQIPLRELQNFAQVSTVILLAFLLHQNFKAGKKAHVFLTLSLLVIFGFWLITGPFKGNIWPQYYKMLLPVIILCITYVVVKYLPSKYYIPIFVVLIGSNAFLALKSGVNYLQAKAYVDETHWKFYRQLVSDILVNSQGQQFGYYVFSPDQFGYQAKYAMRYFDKNQALSYTKQPLTYLIEAPYWDDNKFLSKQYWRNNQVRIDREPDFFWTYSAGESESYTVLRFDLSDAEATISSEPNLLDGIHFR